MKVRFVTVLLMIVVMVGVSAGAVRLPGALGDHMVVQRDKPLQLWGWADPGEDVRVSFRGRQDTCRADEQGIWRVCLGEFAASEKPAELTIRGENTVVLEDVLVGDVWVCSGQSNMYFQLSQSGGYDKLRADAANANVRLLRMVPQAYPNGRPFTAQELARCTPGRFYEGVWQRCTGESAADFSAVGYYFADELIKHTGAPVGLIQNAVGGAPAEAFVSEKTLLANTVLGPVCNNWLASEKYAPWCRQRAALNLRNAETAKNGHPFKPGFLFAAGVEPLTWLAVKGVIWYQGESNATDTDMDEPLEMSYNKHLLKTLISDWRRAWDDDEMPFLYVQLPNMNRNWMEFRQMQLEVSREVPNVGMAVSIDVGDATNVHPKNKRPVGERLARIARARVYGQRVEDSGPTATKAVAAENGIVKVFFEHAQGLGTREGKELTGFELADDAGRWHAVEAEVSGDEVILHADGVGCAAAVRYSWAPNPDGNLVNKDGLPASPFVLKIENNL